MIYHFIRTYFIWRKRLLDSEQDCFYEIQWKLLANIVSKNKSTPYLRSYGIVDQSTFHEKCPAVTYDMLEKYIVDIKEKHINILTKEKVVAFSKSSGTTSRSKWIPMTKSSLLANFKAGRYILSLYLSAYPNSKIVGGKNFSLTGSYQEENGYVVGDISSLFAYFLKPWFKPFRTPSLRVATISDWYEKLMAMVPIISKEDVRWIAGVPSWISVVIEQLETYHDKPILDIWKNLEVYFYGGVDIRPYLRYFEGKLGRDIVFWQTYNASEGFFGLQATKESPDLFFLHNTSNYYEFIPKSDVELENPTVLSSRELTVNEIYELVITNLSGLYRYRMGDLIEITAVSPIRYRIVGRTKNYINVFGEELMVSNTENAIFILSKEMAFEIKNYTIAPIVHDNTGNHHWMIEFAISPSDIELFTHRLDEMIRSLNSDYDAKRYDNIILKPLTVEIVPQGLFEKWLNVNHRLNVQSKIPKLSMDNRIQCELRKLV